MASSFWVDMNPDFWNPPEEWPTLDAWFPSERDVSSEVNFWKKSSDPQGSIPIPAAGGLIDEAIDGGKVRRKRQVNYWKPAFESNWKPPPQDGTTSVWRWTPSSESYEAGGLWKWTPPSQPKGGTNDWKWELVGRRTWKFGPSNQVHSFFCLKPSQLPPLPPRPSLRNSDSEPPSLPLGSPDSAPSLLPLPKPPEYDPKKSSDFSYQPASVLTKDEEESVEIYNRRHRRHDAQLFLKEYSLVHGRERTISSEGIKFRIRMCYDASWVAVHGTDSICVVTRRKDLDMTRVGSFFQRCCSNRQTLSKLVEAVISEVECLPYSDERLCQKSGNFEGPFGVVSVIPVDAKSGHEDSSAAGFINEKIKSGLSFTFDKTIQTAISAFQYLCPKTKLEAIDIWVTVWNERRTEHLHLNQIKEHLKVIRGVSLGGVSSSSTVVSHSGSCSITDDDSNGPRSWAEFVEKATASYTRLKCRCGSKVCGGNGLNPCEIGVMWEKWFNALHL